MITSEAVFDLNATFATNQTAINWLEVPVIGDASETALVKFFQPIEDVVATRGRRKIVTLDDGSLAKMPFNSTNKYALTIVEYQTNDSNYCVFIKGAPEKIWSLC
jgi:sodium/potassium-transporting ATPase subunit alpha